MVRSRWATGSAAPLVDVPPAVVLAHPARHRLGLVAGFLLLSLLLWIFAMSKQPGTFTMLAGGLCVLSMVAVLLPFLMLRDELVASPLTLLALCIFMTMPARFSFVVSETGGYAGPWYFVDVGQDDFTTAAALVTVSLFAFSIVYIVVRVALRQLAPSRGDELKQPAFVELSTGRFIVVATVVLIIAVVMAVVYIKLVGFSVDDLDTVSRKRAGTLGGNAIGSLLYFTNDITTVMLTLTILLAAGRRESRWAFMIFVPPFLFLSVLFPFLSSTRAEIILVLGVSAIAYYLVTRRIPVVPVTVGGVAAFFLFALMSALRNNELRASIDQLSFLDVGIRSLSGSFNLGGFAPLAYAMAVVPERIPFQDGWTIVGAGLELVPRSLWPGKPQVWGYTWIQAFGVDTSTRQGGGAVPGLMGEGYLNFGLPGPTIVMMGYAILVAIYYHFGVVRGRPSLWRYATYVIFMPALTYHMYGYILGKGIMEAVKIGMLLFVACLILWTPGVPSAAARPAPMRAGRRSPAAPAMGRRLVASRWLVSS